MAPGDYAKQLVEQGLALQREAEESSFSEIMRAVRQAAGDVGESEIIRLVEHARKPRGSRGRRNKR